MHSDHYYRLMVGHLSSGGLHLGHLHGTPVREGAGIQARRLSTGIVLEALPVARPRQRKHPFQVFVLENGHIGVQPGTVNALEVETVGGEDDWRFAVPVGTRWVYLEVDISGAGVVSAPKLKIAAAVPEQPEGNAETGTPPAKSYRPVGKVVRDGDGTILELDALTGSQWVSVVLAGLTCTTQTMRLTWQDTLAEE